MHFCGFRSCQSDATASRADRGVHGGNQRAPAERLSPSARVYQRRAVFDRIAGLAGAAGRGDRGGRGWDDGRERGEDGHLGSGQFRRLVADFETESDRESPRQSKPILQIAHHRLEGRIVTLAEPYALLRSTPAPVASTFEVNDEDERPAKRSRNTQYGAEGASPTSDGLSSSKDLFLAPAFSSPEKPQVVARDAPPLIEIVGLVRKKIVFSKRPEPISHPLTSDPAEQMFAK